MRQLKPNKKTVQLMMQHIDGSRGRRRPPPTGSNSFVFASIFAKKWPCRRLVPPPQQLGAPLTRNPGSAIAAVVSPKGQNSNLLFIYYSLGREAEQQNVRDP